MGVDVSVTDYDAFWKCDDCGKSASTSGDAWDGELDDVAPPAGWRALPGEMCEECGCILEMRAYCPECSLKRDEAFREKEAQWEQNYEAWKRGEYKTPITGIYFVGHHVDSLQGPYVQISGSGYNPNPPPREPEW